jgi:hypothetical protein
LDTSRLIMIQEYVHELIRALGGARKPVPPDELRRLYEAKNFAQMVWYIRDQMQLSELRMPVHLVRSGGHPDPAWIAIPGALRNYNPTMLRRGNIPIRVYLRQEYLSYPMEFLAALIAHEMSHVVLAKHRHPLQTSEEAVDLTAMILGYRKFLIQGKIQTHPEMKNTEIHLGYLTDFEARLADKIIDRFAPK